MGKKRGRAGVKRWPQRVCSLGVPLAFRRKGQRTLVCVTPEGGVMASEWTLLQGRAQPSTRAGGARPGCPAERRVGWDTLTVSAWAPYGHA